MYIKPNKFRFLLSWHTHTHTCTHTYTHTHTCKHTQHTQTLTHQHMKALRGAQIKHDEMVARHMLCYRLHKCNSIFQFFFFHTTRNHWLTKGLDPATISGRPFWARLTLVILAKTQSTEVQRVDCQLTATLSKKKKSNKIIKSKMKTLQWRSFKVK